MHAEGKVDVVGLVEEMDIVAEKVLGIAVEDTKLSLHADITNASVVSDESQRVSCEYLAKYFSHFLYLCIRYTRDKWDTYITFNVQKIDRKPVSSPYGYMVVKLKICLS